MNNKLLKSMVLIATTLICSQGARASVYDFHLNAPLSDSDYKTLIYPIVNFTRYLFMAPPSPTKKI
ncbi:MAG: hypothetical protein K2X39_05655, partial [Silvanigrellaceae bacterium]|nr:hypothetical protein [Silvanigrellaceae bacterium]